MPASEHDDLVDRRRVEATIIDCAWGIDTKNWDAVAASFTPNTSVAFGVTSKDELGDAAVYRTRDGIRQYLASSHGGLDASLHAVSNIAIAFTAADTVDVRTYLDVLLLRRDHPRGPTFRANGFYFDRLIRVGPGWQIEVRRFQRIWCDGNMDVVRPG